ncbi:MAG: hypothetical protein QG567_934 [Campylobacterota bacterium]|nr:hypothetical protein [Campylobacterota bacterium]
MNNDKIVEQFNKYIKIFKIKTPPALKIEKKTIGGEINYIDGKLTLILDEEMGINHIVELLAMVKLGEKHPLLAVSKFHESLTEELRNLGVVFNSITQPAISFWAAKIMKEYLPEEDYKREIATILAEIKAPCGATENEEKLDKLSLEHRTALLSGILSVKADASYADTDFFPETFQDGNDMIKETYEFFSKKEPSPEALIEYTKNIFGNMEFSIKDGSYYIEQKKI